MNTANLYSAPEIDSQREVSIDAIKIESVRTAQKLIIYGVLTFLLAIVFKNEDPSLDRVLVFASIILSIFGILKMGTGFNYSIIVKTLLIICMFIPLVGLILLAIINLRATKALRTAGYKVGLIGAGKKQ